MRIEAWQRPPVSEDESLQHSTCRTARPAPKRKANDSAATLCSRCRRVWGGAAEGTYGRPRALARPAFAGGCAGEWWSVSTRSSSSFGFALLNTIRTPVANCRSRYGDEGMAAAMKVAGGRM